MGTCSLLSLYVVSQKTALRYTPERFSNMLYPTKRRTVHELDCPEEPPTVRVYVVVCIGLTDTPPCVGTGPVPESVAELAFCEPHARLADSPRLMTSGFTEMRHEGGPETGGCTVTRV